MAENIDNPDMFAAAEVLDYRWTVGNDKGLSHLRIIDSGASGEVHEVSIFTLIAILILCS